MAPRATPPKPTRPTTAHPTNGAKLSAPSNAVPYCTKDDLAKLLGAMRLQTQDVQETETIDGSITEARKHLDIRMSGQTFFVPFTSIKHCRRYGEDGWNNLAMGTMERLRDRHSLSPQRVFDLSEVYDEAVRALERVAREGCTPAEIDDITVHILERQSGLKDQAAIAKATVNAYVERLGTILRSGVKPNA